MWCIIKVKTDDIHSERFSKLTNMPYSWVGKHIYEQFTVKRIVILLANPVKPYLFQQGDCAT